MVALMVGAEKMERNGIKCVTQLALSDVGKESIRVGFWLEQNVAGVY